MNGIVYFFFVILKLNDEVLIQTNGNYIYLLHE